MVYLASKGVCLLDLIFYGLNNKIASHLIYQFVVCVARYSYELANLLLTKSLAFYIEYHFDFGEFGIVVEFALRN